MSGVVLCCQLVLYLFLSFFYLFAFFSRFLPCFSPLIVFFHWVPSSSHLPFLSVRIFFSRKNNNNNSEPKMGCGDTARRVLLFFSPSSSHVPAVQFFFPYSRRRDFLRTSHSRLCLKKKCCAELFLFIVWALFGGVFFLKKKEYTFLVKTRCVERHPRMG